MDCSFRVYSLTCPTTKTKVNAVINTSETNRNALESHQLSVPTRISTPL